jgi:xyloglucan-specific exo-beta-1,4-glucanase
MAIPVRRRVFSPGKPINQNMRKTLLLCLLLGMFVSANAQLSFESSSEYGRLWDITYDKTVPNKLYARTLVNHIMVSTDNGVTWNILYSFPNSSTYLYKLKILPGGKALSFCAQNNPDPQQKGLYILDLASLSIRQHFILPIQDYPYDITGYDIYDSIAKTVLISTSYMIDYSPFTKVYYTNESGDEWRMVYFSDHYKTVQALNVAISPDNPSKIFLCRGLGAQGDKGGLFVSTNEGTTWTRKLDDAPVSPITFNPKNPKEFFVGSFIDFDSDHERLYHTLDGGETFTVVPIQWTNQTLNHIITIYYDPSDNNIMWMLEENEILKSTDGGKTWASTAFEPNSMVYTSGITVTVNPKNSNQLFIASDAWPQYSADGGKTLTQLKTPYHLAYTVALGAQQLYYATQGGYLHTDLSTHKTKAYGIQPPYLVNVRQLNLRTDTAVPGRLFTFLPGDDFGNSAKLSYSNDYGISTHAIPSDDFANTLQFMQRDPNNKDRYWVSYAYYGSYSTLFIEDFSDPLNAQATPVYPPGFGVISAACILPGNQGNSVYLAIGNQVYLTNDAGLNWEDKSHGLETVTEVRDLHVNPFDKLSLAIVTDQGIFQSADGGDNWSQTFVADDLKKIQFSNVVDGHIIAAAYTTPFVDSRLVFSTNKGTEWSVASAGNMGYLQCYSSMDFKFYADRAEIYFATADLGVVKYELNHLLSPQLLHLTSFSGYAERGKAVLSWNTVDEQGLQDYQLERSINNRDFQLINTQTATGLAGTFSYRYDDNEFSALAAAHKNVYYRLKLTGTDKAFAYSDTVRLSESNMYIYPVPASDVINLHVQGVTEAAKYRILLVDVSGRQYSIQSYSIPTGVTTITMPISRLVSGMYIMLVETRPGEIKKFKFIKL